MRPRFSSLVLLTLSLSWTVLAQGQPPMREGNWEVSMKMGGMDTGAMKQTQCITAAQIKDGPGGMPAGPGSDCKLVDYKLLGNTATYKLSCTQPVPMNISGEMRYASADAYTGTVNIESSGMNMAFQVDAKRIGDCPK